MIYTPVSTSCYKVVLDKIVARLSLAWGNVSPIQIWTSCCFCIPSAQKQQVGEIWMGLRQRWTLSPWAKSSTWQELSWVRCFVTIITFSFTFETRHWWQTAYMVATALFIFVPCAGTWICEKKHVAISQESHLGIWFYSRVTYSGRCQVLTSDLVDFS